VAGYLGFVRAPKVVVKEVRVELTKTEEAPEVAASLMKAAEAARRERYVRPVEDSALHHVELAETQAERLKRKSPGAAMLRRVYASALAVIGNELLKAELTELAIAKFKEALLFQPDDRELRLCGDISGGKRAIELGISRHQNAIAFALAGAKSIAVDYAQHGIRSNAVCPGMAETAMTKWRLDVPELRDAIEARIPLGRVATADDVADLVALLASDRLTYLTGSALVIDGGYTAL